MGLGVGALVSVREGYWTEDRATGLVSKIDWKDADQKESLTLFIEKLGGGSDSTYQRTVDLTRDPSDAKQYNSVEVVSPVSEDLILCMVPEAWESGLDYMEEKYFPKGEARRSWQWEERL